MATAALVFRAIPLDRFPIRLVPVEKTPDSTQEHAARPR
jgi:hypothetical protein